MKRLVIFGAGGHAKSVADIVLASNLSKNLTFVSPDSKKNFLLTFPVIEKYTQKEGDKLFVAVGDNMQRESIFTLYMQNIITIASPLSYISPSARTGEGCFIANFCHIGPFATLGPNSIINTGSIVEHDVTIGRSCHIAPKSVIAGGATLGNMVFVGAGTTIINNIKICDNVVIGAGSTVVSHINEPGTYVGTPARKTRRS